MPLRVTLYISSTTASGRRAGKACWYSVKFMESAHFYVIPTICIFPLATTPSTLTSLPDINSSTRYSSQ